MEEHTVTSFKEFNRYIEKYSHKGFGPGWVYRGQANSEWLLTPKVGREEFEHLNNDRAIFKQWLKDAIAYISLPNNEWECLALAQHYGLATRLLDWSTNPLIAAFFASIGIPEENGAIFCYVPAWYTDQSHVKTPFEVKDRVYAYTPPALDARIINQGGIFTIHPKPNEALKATVKPGEHPLGHLVKITVTPYAKRELLERLNLYGINRKTLFPGLDGLSAHINWQYQEIAEGNRKRNNRNRIFQNVSEIYDG